MVITSADIAKSPYLQRRRERRAARFRSSNNVSYNNYIENRNTQQTPTQNTTVIEGEYVDDQGRGYSIAPEIVAQRKALAQNNGTLFTNSKGQGFSADPNTVVTGYTQKPYKTINKVYASGRTEPTEIKDKTLVYNNAIATPYKTGPKKNILSIGYDNVKNSVTSGATDVVEGIDNTFFPYTPSVQKKIFNPGRELDFLYPSSNSKTLLDGDNPVSKGLSFARDYASDNPTELALTYGAGRLFKYGVGVIPALNSKVVTGGLGALYGGSVVYRLDTVPSYKRSEIIGQESVNLAAFSLGARKTPSDLKIELSNINKRTPNVETVEFFKSRTQSKDFGGNILELDTNGNPILYSGVQETRGGGVFKVGNNFYKARFTESGKTLNTPSGKILAQSNTNMEVMKYEYFINLRKPIKITSKTTNNIISTPEFIKFNFKSLKDIKFERSIFIGKSELGYYDPYNGKVKVNYLTNFKEGRTEYKKTIIHEIGHRQLDFRDTESANILKYNLDTASRFRGKKYNQAVEYFKSQYISAGKIYESQGLGSDIGKKIFYNELSTVSQYPRSQRFEELSVRFAENFPKELANPTTDLGRVLKDVYPKDTILFTPKNINVKEKTLYNIGFNFERVGTSKSSVKMQTTSIIEPTDTGANIESLSIFDGKGGTFRRFTQGKSVEGKDFTFFQGLSKDYSGTKGVRKIVGSDKVVAGKSIKLIELEQDGITNTVTSNINGGRSLNDIKISLKGDIKSNVAKFNKEQFIDSTNGALGLKTTNKNTIQSSVNQNSLKSVVANIAKQDMRINAVENFNKLSAKTGTILITKPTKMPQVSIKNPKLDTYTRSDINTGFKVSPMIKTNTTPSVNTKAGNGLKNSSTFRSRSVNELKNSITPSYDITPKVTTNNLLKQSQGLRQQQQLKQQTLLRGMQQLRGPRVYSPGMVTPIPPIIPSKNDGKFKYVPSRSNIKNNGLSIKTRYNPSIEANIFKIQSKSKPNKTLAMSGLTIRPIVR